MITTEQIGFHPFLPEVIANPHRFYKIMRQEAPILWSPDFRGWMLSRYEDIRHVLRDTAGYTNEKERGRISRRHGDEAATPRTILRSDPPEHTRLRRALDKYFTPRAVSELEPRIREITEGLLEKARRTGRFDVMEDLAVALPTTVIAELLGVPASDRADFKRWANAITQRFNPRTTESEEELRLAELRELDAYLEAAIDARHHRPTDDLLGRLVAVRDEGALSDQEVSSVAHTILSAGHETTTDLIGNAALALLRNRDQLELLKERPELIVSAVEEFLRYDGPVQVANRVVKTPVSFYGVKLEAGDTVVLILASGNRDEKQFESPDELDIRRSPNRHLAFGDGIHICLGQYLARVEARIAVSTLLRDMPDMRLEVPEEELRFRPFRNFRGLVRLPVRDERGEETAT